MLNIKLIALLILAGSTLVAGSSITYYYGYSLPQKDKEVLALQRAKRSVTPTPTPTATPSAAPTPKIIRYFPPTPTPSPTVLSPTVAPIQATDIKNTLNDYNDCKQACPKVGGGTTCKDNSNGSSTCTHTSDHPDQVCIDSCKSQYGLSF
jgi:hypothetical protein